MNTITGRKAFTIDEFCERHSISRGLYYKLKKQGKTPRITELGAKLIITEEDETAWRQTMAAESSTEKSVVA